MLTKIELRKIARARLRDAEALFAARRYDGAVYLCGYVVELGLKARICKTLRWEGYPSSPKEFKDFGSFKIHDLDVLLRLSGVERKVKSQLFIEWSSVAQWSPEARYQPIGKVNKEDVQLMINSATTLLNKL